MDELEQLKRDNEVLYRDNVALSETADRLRDALEMIKGSDPFPSGTPTEQAMRLSFRIDYIRSIARAALEVK
mgnify:FL=1